MSPVRRSASLALVILASFAGAGALGAIIWEQAVTLPTFERTAQGASLDEVQLSHIVGIDGTYVLIALGLSLLVTIVVMWRVRLDPVARVLLLAAGAIVAAWVMVKLGLALGPHDPGPLVKSMAVGQKLPIQLKPHSPLVGFTWPVVVLFVSFFALLGGRDREVDA